MKPKNKGRSKQEMRKEKIQAVAMILITLGLIGIAIEYLVWGF